MKEQVTAAALEAGQYLWHMSAGSTVCVCVACANFPFSFSPHFPFDSQSVLTTRMRLVIGRAAIFYWPQITSFV